MSDTFHRWVVVLTPTVDETPLDLVWRHCRHLERLEDEGVLELAGPFDDKSGGMLVLRGVDEARARAIAAADPFVAEGVRTVTLKGWSLSSRENNHMGMGSG